MIIDYFWLLALPKIAEGKQQSSRLPAQPPQKGLQAKKLNFQAVLKLAASAASAKTIDRRLADYGGRGAPLELAPLGLIFGEAALAAN